ncbi:MAG: hypothetical protein Q4C41_06945 [Eggerthellaceae bacterium]|nr:hypothetical protein [Eggerthellaceae bacterium]
MDISDLALGFFAISYYAVPIVIIPLVIAVVCLLVSINRKLKKNNELVGQLACKPDATGTEHECN